MSTETVILLAIRELQAELAETRRSLDLLAKRVAPAPDRLRTREACEYLGVTDSTLYRWAERGLVQHHGGPRPWDRRELEIALRGTRQQGPGRTPAPAVRGGATSPASASRGPLGRPDTPVSQATRRVSGPDAAAAATPHTSSLPPDRPRAAASRGGR